MRVVFSSIVSRACVATATGDLDCNCLALLSLRCCCPGRNDVDHHALHSPRQIVFALELHHLCRLHLCINAPATANSSAALFPTLSVTEAAPLSTADHVTCALTFVNSISPTPVVSDIPSKRRHKSMLVILFFARVCQPLAFYICLCFSVSLQT